jgi:hypothetical protein
MPQADAPPVRPADSSILLGRTAVQLPGGQDCTEHWKNTRANGVLTKEQRSLMYND